MKNVAHSIGSRVCLCVWCVGGLSCVYIGSLYLCNGGQGSTEIEENSNDVPPYIIINKTQRKNMSERRVIRLPFVVILHFSWLFCFVALLNHIYRKLPKACTLRRSHSEHSFSLVHWNDVCTAQLTGQGRGERSIYETLRYCIDITFSIFISFLLFFLGP